MPPLGCEYINENETTIVPPTNNKLINQRAILISSKFEIPR